MRPSVEKSGLACGAEIVFDLAQDIDDATFRELEHAFHDNIVVVFRGQDLSDERHVEFSRRFGELEIHIVKKYLLPGYPEMPALPGTPTPLTAGGRAAARCSSQRRCRIATVGPSVTQSSRTRSPRSRRCRQP
jgi:alpha-ketoglutarate-dependent taurine dioxygenase